MIVRAVSTYSPGGDVERVRLGELHGVDLTRLESLATELLGEGAVGAPLVHLLAVLTEEDLGLLARAEHERHRSVGRVRDGHLPGRGLTRNERLDRPGFDLE